MIGWILKKIVGSKNQRLVKSLRPLIDRINKHEEEFQRLSDEELRAKSLGWKAEFVQMTAKLETDLQALRRTTREKIEALQQSPDFKASNADEQSDLARKLQTAIDNARLDSSNAEQATVIAYE